MITDKEAEELMNKYVALRDNKNKNENEKIEFKKIQNECIRKFKYLVDMRTNKYKKFSNYKDLEQDGLEALYDSMITYKPEKNASFFYWAHNYILTKIQRCAANHFVVRHPLKVSKEQAPIKVAFEDYKPFLSKPSTTGTPEDVLEKKQIVDLINKNISSLTQDELDLVRLTFNSNEVPISDICKYKDITYQNYSVQMDRILKKLKKVIK